MNYFSMLEIVKERTTKFSFEQNLALSLLCCERLYPNYTCFVKITKWGNPEVLLNSIKYIEEVLLSGKYEDKTINSFLEELNNVIPDTEDFDTGLASSALDAGSVIGITLDYIRFKNPQDIVEICALCLDTVDMYISDEDNIDFNNDPDEENNISNAPLMQREFRIQTEILNFLDGKEKIFLADLEALRQLQFNDGKSNIDLN